MGSERYDVAVIGAGLGGLSCAAFLAKQGLKVGVFEQHYQPGGYCHSFRRGPYVFDAAVEYIGCCGEGQDIWHALRLLDADRFVTFDEMDPDGFDRFHFPRHRVAVCKDVETYEDRLAALFPRERKGLQRYFEILKKIWQEIHAGRVGVFLWKFKRFPIVCPTLQWSTGKTLKDLLDATIKSPTLRAILAAQSGDYALPPSQVDLVVHATIAMHFHEGAYYPRGGVQRLPDALVKALTNHGGQLFLRQGVRRIRLQRGRVAGVELESGRFAQAQAVVSSGDPRKTLLEMVDGQQAVTARLAARLRRATYSLASFQVYLGVKLDLQQLGLGAANYWLCPSYDFEGLYRSLLEGRIPEKAYILATAPSLKDSSRTLAPAGAHIVKLITPISHRSFTAWNETRLARRGSAYKDLKERVADNLIKQAEELIPGLESSIDCRVVGTPLTNTAYTRAPEGAMYGLARTPGQSGPAGLSPSTRIPGLYLTGTNVYYPGVLGALASGIMSGTLLLGDCEEWLRPMSTQRSPKRRAYSRRARTQ